MMFAHNQPARLGSRLLLILMGLAWVLTACNNESVPKPPTTAEQGAFEFLVDPQRQTVTLIANETSTPSLQPQYLPSDTRILVPNVDISLENYHYVFHHGNKLIIQTRFRNVTEDAEFLQPFFFTLNADTEHIKSATAPLVLDKDLGGDGVLSLKGAKTNTSAKIHATRRVLKHGLTLG